MIGQLIEQLMNPGILLLAGIVATLYIGVLILRNEEDPS